MFQSARLKLTSWYLLIIMLISILFSLVIYTISDNEIQRVIRRIQIQTQLEDNNFFFSPPPNLPRLQELEEAEGHLKITLVLINIAILVLSGGAGYFLAGRTLKPIKEMVDEQNRFITDSSHELRTPLTALRSEMEAYLLEKNLKINESKELIKSNLEEVINLQYLSDNLLQLAQFMPSGQKSANLKQTFQKITVSAIINDAIKKATPLARNKHINIISNITDATFLGEKSSLIQLLIILLDNSIKYSSDNTDIHISTVITSQTVKIIIEDNGIGIDKKDLPHIFDRFYRADKSRAKSEIPGYGLGLSIAKKIIDMHNGTINVKSKINKGTTLTIELPIN